MLGHVTKKADGTAYIGKASPAGIGPIDEPPAPSVHAALRLATRLDHQRVDLAISRFDLGCAEGYAAFLSLNAAALETLRPDWRDQDISEFEGLLGSLAADLEILGVTPLVGPAKLHRPINGLGLAYVVRGARLGARLLRQRVPADLPAAFLDFTPSLSWPGFLRQLNSSSDGSPRLTEGLVRGARETFEVYNRLARLCGAPA